ncbi:MAG TPA: GNAT family N-acetyltransferase, partial [Candidatus Coprovivens excrementavium]|nr:GNAT family N-acetyltransferase [Candidatus Coprovivens excrementavium]
LNNEENISIEEKNKILKYVNQTTSQYINDYQLIVVSNKIVGCLLLREYEDGKLLDELYLIPEYRNQHIGTSIIMKIISTFPIIYLYVYKENKIALNLYLKYQFKIIAETKSRYYMQYKI